MTRWLAGVVMAMSLGAAPAAFEVVLDRRGLEEAIAIGQSRIEPIRTRFHAPYRVTVGSGPVDYLEIVTPFRSIVLGAEARARAGDRSFGLREAQELLGATGDELTIRLELTFHPHNTYVGVPNYQVSLVTAKGGQELEPLRIETFPRFGPRVGVDGAPGPGGVRLPGDKQPLTGGRIDARFRVSSLAPQASYEVVVREGKTTLARALLDLIRVR